MEINTCFVCYIYYCILTIKEAREKNDWRKKDRRRKKKEATTRRERACVYVCFPISMDARLLGAWVPDNVRRLAKPTTKSCLASLKSAFD